jgi:cell shape-determining protein MreC
MNSKDLGKFLVLLILAIVGVFIAIAISVSVGSSSISIVTNVILSLLGAVSSFILRSAFFESFVTILGSLFLKSYFHDGNQDGKARILEQEAIINLYTDSKPENSLLFL